jgi:hypothetical protein
MDNISRRVFLKDLGVVALSTFGIKSIASAFDDNTPSSLVEKQNYIIEELKKVAPVDHNIGGTWYKTHEMSSGFGDSRFFVQLTDSYLTMLSFAEKAQSFYNSVSDGKLDGKKRLAVRNKKQVSSDDRDNIVEEIMKLENDSSYQPRLVEMEKNPDAVRFETLINMAYDSLKPKG